MISLLQKYPTTWTPDELRQTLEGLVYAQKKTTWIRKDLSTVQSTLLGRLFWTLFAKYSSCLRLYFYGIDNKVSRRSLIEMKAMIDPNSDLMILYDRAIANFTEVTKPEMVILNPLPFPVFKQIRKPTPPIKISKPLFLQRTVRPKPYQPMTQYPKKPIPKPCHTHLQVRRPPSFRPNRTILVHCGRQIPGTGRKYR